MAKGQKFISDLEGIPSRLYTQIFDIDIASGYPTSGVIANISKETCLREVCEVEGLSEFQQRRSGVDMTATRTNAIELAQTLYHVPSMEETLNSFMRDIA